MIDFDAALKAAFSAICFWTIEMVLFAWAVAHSGRHIPDQLINDSFLGAIYFGVAVYALLVANHIRVYLRDKKKEDKSA